MRRRLHCRDPGRVPADPVDEDRQEAIGQVIRVAPGLEPGVRPVRRGEKEQRRRTGIEVGAKIARLDALAEERAPALLVTPPLGDDLVAVLALEVAPLAREHGRDVELLGDDTKMTAQRVPHAVGSRRILGHRVERRVERIRSLAHRLEQELLLRAGQRVERALLHAERLRERIHRRPVEPALREQPCRLARQRLTPRSHYTRC